MRSILLVVLCISSVFAVPMAEEKIVPMMEMEYPEVAMRRPVFRHEITQSTESGYKHLGIATSPETFNPLLVTPLLSETHEHKAKAQEEKIVIPKRIKKFAGLTDKGVREDMNIRVSIDPNVKNVHVDEETNTSLKAKALVGFDSSGTKRYLDIPYYNRASDRTD